MTWKHERRRDSEHLGFQGALALLALFLFSTESNVFRSIPSGGAIGNQVPSMLKKG